MGKMKQLAIDCDELAQAIRERRPYRFPHATLDYIKTLLHTTAKQLSDNENQP